MLYGDLYPNDPLTSPYPVDDNPRWLHHVEGQETGQQLAKTVHTTKWIVTLAMPAAAAKWLEKWSWWLGIPYVVTIKEPVGSGMQAVSLMSKPWFMFVGEELQ